MNQLNETLRAIRTSKQIIQKKIDESYDMREMFLLSFQLDQLSEEETKLLRVLDD